MVLSTLWMPVLLSAVIVFIASSIAHMVLPHHRSDYHKLPNEEAARGALKGVPAGVYMIPYCTHKKEDMEAAKPKFAEGPVAIVTMRPPGEVQLGKFLGLWFVFCVLVSYFTAYVALHTLPRGTHYTEVFRIVGATAFLGYGLSQFANSIWKGQPWSVTVKEMIDGLVYALLTAGTFGWLWPR
jgi:hypothetical protein